MTAQLELLASGFGSIEGPTADANGDLYFTDAIGGGVYKRSSAGEIETIVPKRKGVGGTCLHSAGGIVVSGRDLTHARGGENRILIGRGDYAAAGLDPGTSFNDIHADDQGRIFVSALWGGAFNDQVKGGLAIVTAPGKITLLYDGVAGANGMALDWKRRRLYHCATYDREVIVSEASGAADYKITERLSTRDIDGFPDGMALDEEGCLWVAFYQGGAVMRLAPDGRVLARIGMPAHEVTSLCFGGADGRDLIIVTGDNTKEPALRGCVFRVRVDVRGAPVGSASI